MTPEPYDVAEAQRLVEDVSALLAEAEAGNSADPETATRLREQIAGDPEAEERLGRAVASKEGFYREASALWHLMAAGVTGRDMAKVRGAHVGLRTLALAELEGGEAD
jgi:hypothetical protein